MVIASSIAFTEESEMSKKSNKPVDVIIEELTPTLVIEEANIFAEYYHDLSGFIEIVDHKGHQIYCNESGRLPAQIKALAQHIAELEQKTVPCLKKALAILEKRAKGYLK
jgi:hypothetical protein